MRTPWSKPQVELGQIEEVRQRGVRGVDHLEAAVKAEAVDGVGHDPTAQPGTRLEQQHLGPGGGQLTGGGQPGRPAADDHDVTVARQVAHPVIPS